MRFFSIAPQPNPPTPNPPPPHNHQTPPHTKKPHGLFGSTRFIGFFLKYLRSISAPTMNLGAAGRVRWYLIANPKALFPAFLSFLFFFGRCSPFYPMRPLRGVDHRSQTWMTSIGPCGISLPHPFPSRYH